MKYLIVLALFLSACSPTVRTVVVTATNPAVTITPTQLPPTDTPIPPTPTRVPASSIDIDSVLVKPAGFLKEITRDELGFFSRAPQPDNFIARAFDLADDKFLIVGLSLYDDLAKSELAYGSLLPDLGDDPQPVTTIGEKATLAFSTLDMLGGQVFTYPTIIFTRCGAVAYMRLSSDDSKPDILLEYGKLLDQSIIEKVC